MAEQALAANLALQETVRARIDAVLSARKKTEALLASLQSLASEHSLPPEKATQKYNLPRKPPYFVDLEMETPPPNLDAQSKAYSHIPYMYKNPGFPHQQKLQEEVERENKRILSRNGKDPIPDATDPRLRSNTTGINWTSIARTIPDFISTKTATDCRIHYLVNQHPSVNRQLFSKAEVQRLQEIGETLGWVDWDLIASELGNGRVAWQCFRVYQKYINPLNQAWTPEEDARLLELVSKFGSNWVEISRQIGTRNRSQCLLRWRQTLKPGVSRGRWTKSEDEKLVEAVNIHGLNSWTKVSGHVETRNDAQCRERYLNTLNPDLKRGDFSKQENDLLLELVAKHGPKWAKVATDMRTRTAKMCKRQYEAISSFGDEVDEDVVDEDE